jgi:protein TonB
MLQPFVSFTWETPRMSINLIESERHSERSLRGTSVSIALHAGLITLAVYATANAGQLIVKTPFDTVSVFYPAQPKEPARPHEAPAHPSHPRSPELPREPGPHVPVDIPDKLPPIDPPTGSIPTENLFPTSVPGSGTQATGPLTGAGSGEPMFASEVDKPVMARAGNPIPAYPSMLESSRVEGSVVVQFVVDTLGRPDMHSFTVLESSNALFVESLRSVLAKWRFYPAEAGGRTVRQIVQLPLEFVAPRR